MFENKYKADNEKIEPTQESLLSLGYKMKREQAKKDGKRKIGQWLRPTAATAAALVLLLGCFQIFRSLSPRDNEIPAAGGTTTGEAELPQQQAQQPDPDDYSQVYAQIKEMKDREKQSNGNSVWDLLFSGNALAENEDAVESTTTGEGGAQNDTGSAEKNYSDTNNQVEGVQEADIIKTDGEYIYTVVDGDVYLLKENNGQPQVLSKIAKKVVPGEEEGFYKQEEYVNDIYIAGNRLVLMKYTVDYTAYDGAAAEDMAPAGCCYMGEEKYSAAIYDITDRSNPVLLNELGQSGSVVSSRMVGNILYLVSNYYVPGEIDEADPATYVPSLYCGDASSEIPAYDIMLLPAPNGTQYLTVSSIDVSDPSGFLDTQSILGCGSQIYCNAENLFVASVIYEGENDVFNYKTDLYRFSLEDGAIAMEGQGTVPGNVLNQFSMDEYKGYFRLVTTETEINYSNYNDNEIVPTIEYNTKNHLFVLDGAMNVVGSMEDLARGESIYSARFMGDVGYFVTYRQVDPLFTVDLSAPANPTLLSELKVPGFSNHLHPFGDGLLLGFGQDADEQSGTTQGLKLSMFDTSDLTAVTEKHTVSLGEKYMWSNASYNHKAILVDTEKNLIGFPAENEYLIYSYSPASGFQKVAQLSLEASGPDEYDYDLRGFYVDDVFYLYGPRGLAAFSMKDFSRLSTLLWEE